MTSENVINNSETVQITTEDGHVMDAYKVPAQGESIGGLVILQEIFGATDQLKSVAQRYAKQGFDVILPSLFDRVSPQTVISFDEGMKGRDLMLSVDKEKVLLDIAAAANAIDSGKGVSVLGFCWGGGLAMRSAVNLDLKSAVAFYGTRLGDMLDVPPKCPMMFHFGDSDEHSPQDVIDGVRGAFTNSEVHVYAAGHAFANDARDLYVEDAAQLAHERTAAFLIKSHAA